MVAKKIPLVVTNSFCQGAHVWLFDTISQAQKTMEEQILEEVHTMEEENNLKRCDDFEFEINEMYGYTKQFVEYEPYERVTEWNIAHIMN